MRESYLKQLIKDRLFLLRIGLPMTQTMCAPDRLVRTASRASDTCGHAACQVPSQSDPLAQICQQDRDDNAR